MNFAYFHQRYACMSHEQNSGKHRVENAKKQRHSCGKIYNPSKVEKTRSCWLPSNGEVPNDGCDKR